MFRLIQNGVMVGLGDKPSYIRMQDNGSYGFCDKADAQGVAVDSTAYTFDTVTMEDVSSGVVSADFAAAAAVYAAQADARAIPDRELATHPDLFPRLKGDGSLIEAGHHINWHGIIYRAANALWDTPENTPDNAPGLWEAVVYRDGYRVLTGPISASNPVQVDEICWYEDEKWKNILGVPSVYLPSEYPAGWEKVVEA